MKPVFRPAVLFALFACLAAPVASKPVYKWVDEHGVVNYTTEPPPAASAAKALSTVSTKISSFDPVVAGLDAASQQKRNQKYLRDRVDQLQHELDSLRHARQTSSSRADETRRRRMEECQRQRRVDCDTYVDAVPVTHTVVGVRPVFINTGYVPTRVQTPATVRVHTPRLAMMR